MPNAAQVPSTVICRRHLLDLLVTTKSAQKHARRQNVTVDFYLELILRATMYFNLFLNGNNLSLSRIQ